MAQPRPVSRIANGALIAGLPTILGVRSCHPRH